MKNAIYDMFRIESLDLDAIMGMPNSLPMRLGEQIAGRARISQVGDRFILDLSSETKQRFVAKRFMFPEHLQKLFCLLCPKCEEWRKRLFLNDVSFGPLSRNLTHSLECKDCIASTVAKRARRSKPYAQRRWK
jgi:hypothetical protein